MRTCKTCGTEKPLEDFKRVGPGGQARMGNCRKCYTLNRRNGQRSGRTWQDIHLTRRYGISEQDFHELEQKQGHVCALCKKPEHNGFKGRTTLCVDHDHETGKVRGLLCNHCNRALGLLYDNVETLQNAIDYLTRPEPKPL